MDPDTVKFLREYRATIPPLADDRTDDLVLDARRGKGTRVFDEAGKEHVDFGISVAVSAIGYNHPEMVELHSKLPVGFYEGCAVPWRMKDITIAGQHYEISPLELGRRLLPLMFPSLSLDDLGFFADVTGGTAVNAACKLAFKARPGISAISFYQAFHGRHGFGETATCSKPVQKEGYPNFGPVPVRLPYPTDEEAFKWALYMLKFVPFKDVSYVIYEPLQGEGGYRLPKIRLMDELLGMLRDKGILLIDDEIQTFARTGKPFAYQHGNIVPDIVICGKGLGGDVPISAVGYNRRIFGFSEHTKLERGWYGGTYMNYLRGVASAILTLVIMERDRLVENAAVMGAKLTEILEEFSGYDAAGLFPYCLRTGTGLMQSLAFFKKNRDSDPKRRNLVLRKLRETDPGILTHGCGLDDINPGIRFAPPMISGASELLCLKEALERAMKA